MTSFFKNIINFTNYNASKNTFERDIYVVTSDLRYLFYEQLSKLENQEKEMFFKKRQKFTASKTHSFMNPLTFQVKRHFA